MSTTLSERRRITPRRLGAAAVLTGAPSAYPDAASLVGGGVTATRTVTTCAVPCTNDTSERPRLSAWLHRDRG
ncbi:hypothetical protein STENM223S_00444 [Streptomyces tendae]